MRIFKRIIVIAIVAIGIGYAWWWSQPMSQLINLSTEPDFPQDWAELSQQCPQLSVVFRILSIDPYVHASNPFYKPVEIAPRVSKLTRPHIWAGIVMAISGTVIAMAGFRTGSSSRETPPKP